MPKNETIPENGQKNEGEDAVNLPDDTDLNGTLPPGIVSWIDGILNQAMKPDYNQVPKGKNE